MRKLIWIIAAAVSIIGGSAFAAWVVQGPKVPPRDLANLEGNIDRGAYVARLAGCIACHTDTKSGRSVLAGGAAIKTDFGSFYPPNITPHTNDGIGNWTVDDFARALPAGTSPGGEHYFPSFPYPFYTRLSNQDIADLWAAVRSVPQVAGKARPHDLNFPYGNPKSVGAWKRLFMETGELTSVADKSDAWNRGRYLARGPAHCGACHTPRNVLGGRKQDRRFGGGIGPAGEKIPKITPRQLSSRGWSKDDLIYAFRTGIKPNGDVFGGSMAEVVRDGTRFWSDADLSALADYVMNAEVIE